MFKFNFDLDDLEETDPFGAPEETSTATIEDADAKSQLKSFAEHALDDLVSPS